MSFTKTSLSPPTHPPPPETQQSDTEILRITSPASFHIPSMPWLTAILWKQKVRQTLVAVLTLRSGNILLLQRWLPHTRLNIVIIEFFAVAKETLIRKCEHCRRLCTDMNIFRGKHPVACCVTCICVRACVICLSLTLLFISASVLQKIINITAENFGPSSGLKYVHMQICK